MALQCTLPSHSLGPASAGPLHLLLPRHRRPTPTPQLPRQKRRVGKGAGECTVTSALWPEGNSRHNRTLALQYGRDDSGLSLRRRTPNKVEKGGEHGGRCRSASRLVDGESPVCRVSDSKVEEEHAG